MALTSFSMPVSFLTKSIYLTNCNPILESPDHALFITLFMSYDSFLKSFGQILLNLGNPESAPFKSVIIILEWTL